MRRLLVDSGLEVAGIDWTFGFFGTLAFDVFFVTGDSQPNPILYLALLPFYFACAALDVLLPCRAGSAILAAGRKP